MSCIDQIDLRLKEDEPLNLVGNEGSMEFHQSGRNKMDSVDVDISIISFSRDDWETIKLGVDFYFQNTNRKIK